MAKKKTEPETIEIPKVLRIQASLTKGTLQASAEGKVPSVSMRANSGEPMNLPGYPYPVIVNLAKARFARDNTPIIMEHDVKRRVGHITASSIDTMGIFAEGLISCTTDDAKQVIEDTKNGFIFQVSIGAGIEAGYVVPKGQSVVVNGKSHAGPVIVSDETIVHDVSLTSVGADLGNSAKIAASIAPTIPREKRMNPDFKKWLESVSLDPEKLNESQLGELQASWDATQTAKKLPVKKIDDTSGDDLKADLAEIKASMREETKKEVNRIKGITQAFKEFEDVENITIDGKEIAASLYMNQSIDDESVTPEQVELKLLRASRTRPTSFTGGHDKLSADSANFKSQVIEASLCRQLGVPESAENTNTGKKYGLEHDYSDKVLEASMQKDNRYFRFSDLLALNIEANGGSFSGSRSSEDFIRAGLYASYQLAGGRISASGPFSTLAISNILENVANKRLLSAFNNVEGIWSQIAGTESVDDFKVQSYYRLNVKGNYDLIPPGGELKHGEFSDEKQTVQADTRGLMLGLDRRQMINDDLSAFNQIPDQLGRKGALALEYAVVGLLLNPSAGFFVTTPAGSINEITDDFGPAGLTTAVQTFMNRIDANSDAILLSPDRVIVGVQDKEEAEQLFADRMLTVTTTADLKTVPSNPHAGKYKVVSSPIISNTAITGSNGAAITGADTDQWFLMANPAIAPALRVAFLRGRRVPFIESSETSFNTLGMQWRSYFDFGVGEADNEYALRSTGSP